jgi:hypothetical protein
MSQRSTRTLRTCLGGRFRCRRVGDGEPQGPFDERGEHLEQRVAGQVVAKHALAHTATQDVTHRLDGPLLGDRKRW